MRVLQMILIETGTYEDAVIRPYTTNLSQENNAVELLREATNYGQIVTPGVIAGLASSVLTQTANPEGICAIPNNWTERRLRFFMEIEMNSTNMTRNRQLITGYTDYVGFSALSGSAVNFDPRMQLYINNSVLLRDSMFADPATGARAFRSTVADDSQILRGGYVANMNGQIQDAHNTFALRPEDLMGVQAANLQVMQRGGGDVWDTRASMVQGARKSHRDNGIASRYLAKTITALGQAYSNTDVDNEPSSAVYNQAFTAVQEQKMYHDNFFATLNNRTQYQHTGSVTWSELCQLFQGLDDVATLVRPGSTQQVSEQYQRGQMEHWYGTTTETLFASRLMAAVPGIMIENMMTRAFFTATNRTANGQFVIQFGEDSVAGFTNGIDLTGFMTRFEATLIQEVLATLTQNNLIDIDLSMFVNIMGETRISISIGGAPYVDYAAPSFCDALFSPVVTLNAQSITDIGADIDRLVSFINVPAPNFGVGAGNPGYMGR